MPDAMAQHGHSYVSTIRRGEETNLHEDDDHPEDDAGAARLRRIGKKVREKTEETGDQSCEKRVCEEK